MALVEPLISRPTLNLQRVFDGPRELVWSLWTKPELLVLWLGPVDWPAITARSDFRVGGEWRACLKSVNTDDLLWQGGVYLEINAPERLVFTFMWDESHEEGPPVETLITVVLSAMDDGRTHMDFTHEGLKSEQSLIGHERGWISTFKRLESYLADLPRK